jgi:hypothetical protein
MKNKLIYWIPVVGAFVSLIQYDKDNGMGAWWGYYQAFTLIILIWVISFLQYGGH